MYCAHLPFSRFYGLVNEAPTNILSSVNKPSVVELPCDRALDAERYSLTDTFPRPRRHASFSRNKNVDNVSLGRKEQNVWSLNAVLKIAQSVPACGWKGLPGLRNVALLDPCKLGLWVMSSTAGLRISQLDQAKPSMAEKPGPVVFAPMPFRWTHHSRS